MERVDCPSLTGTLFTYDSLSAHRSHPQTTETFPLRFVALGSLVDCMIGWLVGLPFAVRP
jgi:hypothetical protein